MSRNTRYQKYINISRSVPDPLKMTFQVAGLDEIKQWIMSLGPEAYVIKPEKLKNMVKADLKKSLLRYEARRPAYLRPQARKSQSNYFS